MGSQLEKNDFHKRLAILIGDKPPYSWAADVGIPKGSFHKIWKKGGAPLMSHLQLIAKKVNISLDWLVLGEGPMKKGETAAEPELESACGKDEFLHYIDECLAEMEKKDPDTRPWFRYEFKNRFPEIIEWKKQAVTAETSAKTAQVHEKKTEVKNDKDFNIRQQIADIKDALTVMGIKTGIFKEKKEAEINADATIEQQVSGIRDTLNAVCIKMGLLEERRKEQIPINFPDRRHSEHNR